MLETDELLVHAEAVLLAEQSSHAIQRLLYGLTMGVGG